MGWLTDAIVASTAAGLMQALSEKDLEGQAIGGHMEVVVPGQAGTRDQLYSALQQRISARQIQDAKFELRKIDNVQYLRVAWGPASVYCYAGDVGKDLLVALTTTSKSSLKWHQLLLAEALRQVVTSELASALRPYEGPAAGESRDVLGKPS